MNKRLFIFLLTLLFSSNAVALSVEEPLPESSQEMQARALFYDIRCVVCQGESLADSSAEVARDMRMLIRQKIQNGETTAAIKTFLVSRYGDRILMTPPLKPATYALWFGPLAIFLSALCMAGFYFRRQKS